MTKLNKQTNVNTQGFDVYLIVKKHTKQVFEIKLKFIKLM